MIDLDVTTYEFEHDDVKWAIYSHKALPTMDTYLIRLMGPNGVEITVEALTRGEGMVILADMLKSLGYRLAREAFEQEGAVRIRSEAP